MTDLNVSVVVVSRGRADLLPRCLLGISQLQYDGFEVIVVADPAGIEAASGLPFSDNLKLIEFDAANISAARNLGVSHAAGDIVAFIDDDAVPEPQWLRYLIAPAAQHEVAAMGGFVRGRNGISWQWTARSLGPLGEAHPIDIDLTQASVLHPPKGKAIKTEGTNMAFRRGVLVELGGFDPAFHYFLDETDLNMRLARAGYATALVPLAEVHHGFAPNSLRTQARVPRDLFDIGASWAVFQRKHLPDDQRVPQWLRLRSMERQRLLRHLVTGGLEPRGVRRLMARLDAGYAAGQTRALGGAKVAAHSASGFKRFASARRQATVISTRPFHLAKALKDAAKRVNDGEIVTVLSLSLSAAYHKILFTSDGVWLQNGGLFGRSERTEPMFSIRARSARVQKELGRVSGQRGLRNI